MGSYKYDKEKPLLTVSEIVISYRNKVPFTSRPKIKCSSDAEVLFRSYWSDDIEMIEEFNVMYLDRSKHVKGINRFSRGGCASTVLDPRLLFASALKCLCFGLIVAHNHPSGNLVSSVQDNELTEELKQIGKFHNIILLDHLILAPQVGFYYSFADNGML